MVKKTIKSIAPKMITKVMTSRGRRAIHDLDNNSKNAVNISEQLLFELLKQNKNTEYGKKYHFSEIHSVEEYKKRVPLSDYDDYEPYIRRMVKSGEKNLLTVDEPKHYALSSGSVGVPKHIPVSQRELDKYSKYGPNMAFGVMDEYYENTTRKPLPGGFGMNAIELKIMETEHGVSKGAISATVLKPLKKLVPYFFTSPWSIICPEQDMDMKYLKLRFALPHADLTFLDAAFMTGLVDLMDYLKDNWQMLCKDIYEGTINEKIKLPDQLREELLAGLKPEHVRAKQLKREFKKGFETPIIPRIWPKIAWIGAIGTGGFFTYSKKMRSYTGRNVPFHNLVYAASESLMATARHPGDTSYVLVPDGGFYEFIPVKADDDSKTLTIDELEEGEDYEIILTNLSGFYRYRIKDVIRVTGFYNEAPLIQFLYRKNQVLSIAGEKTNEEALRWSMEQFIKDTGLNINDYSVYADVDTEPGHYVFLMEPDEIVSKEKIAEYRDIIEQKLMQANPSYGDKIRTGVLGKTELIFVQQQTYQLYRDVMVMKGVSPNQLKPVRVIDTPFKEKFFFGLKEMYD